MQRLAAHNWRVKMKTTSFYIERASYGRRYDLHALQIMQNGDRSIARPALFEAEDDAGEKTLEPVLSMNEKAAQELMDALWDVGLRPTEGSGSAGSLAATERHLKDMRAIAMGLLSKDGVPAVGAA